MALNVNRKVDDPFYRYKMPKLIAKVEGRGNGIKTVIPNMVEIAKALDRPPTYPTKYFGCELGAQTLWDEKAERYIVNGAHRDEDLQNHLDGFIEKFVLCPGCHNPETRLKVKRKEIEQKCVACGFRGPLTTTHRLTTFIVNHPPHEDKDAKGKGGKKAGRKGKKSRGDEDEGVEEEGAAAPQTEGNNAAGARANVAEREGGMVAAPETREVDEDDWSVDTSAAAVRAREEAQLSGAVSKLVLAADSERTMEERLELFHQYVEERRSQDKFPAKDVLAMAERLECKEKGVMVLVELLLDDDEILVNIKRHHALLQRFTDGSKKTQKYLIHALEKMIERRPVLLTRVMHMFNALYELDIVEEDAFVSWGEKVSKKYVSRELSQKIHDAATPFLKWLDEAESDSEEEEDAIAEDVQFDTGVSGVKTEVVAVEPPPPVEGVATAADDAAAAAADAASDDDDEEDDIDIDDI